MKSLRPKQRLLVIASLSVGLAPAARLLADGSETLGAPLGLDIAPGTGVAAAGTGLVTQPGTILLEVPAAATVRQAILYWQHRGTSLDDTIVVNGTEIRGAVIGQGGFPPGPSTSFRADITRLGLVQPGSNALKVEGLAPPVDEEHRNDGAAVVAILDEGGDAADLQVRDGNDFAFHRLAPPYDTTVPQTFNFEAVAGDRVAELFLLVGDGTADRPDEIEVRVGDTVRLLSNEARSRDGAQWDTIALDVLVPAGETAVTVQLFSRDTTGMGGSPESLSWVAAAFSLSRPRQGGEGCTPGYWKQPHHFDSWPAPYTPRTPFSDVFDDAFPRKTLLQVLKLRGGKLNALGRHAVAALLNAASGGVSYDLSPDQVISLFNAAFHGSKAERERAKNLLERFNSQGCPLN